MSIAELPLGFSSENKILSRGIGSHDIQDFNISVDPRPIGLASADVVKHDFTIGYFVASPDGTPVNVLGINNQVPSPTIVVREGDTLVVNVVNNDPLHSHSIHWHGLTQNGSPEMDGVVGVSQCGLPPSKSMTYQFEITDSPGTYWYHGHSGLTKNGSRGIGGMIIIKPKELRDEVHSKLYTEESELFLQDWSRESPHDNYMKNMGGLNPPVAQSANAHNVALVPWTSGLMNGASSSISENGMASTIQLKYPAGKDGVLALSPTSRTRLRIVNGGGVFALKVSVDRHKLLVISTDGTDTEVLEVDSVIVHIGERYDVVPVLRAGDQESVASFEDDGNYWIRARTLESDGGAQVPMNHEIRGILRYDRYAALVQNEPNETHEVAFENSNPKQFGHFTRIRSNVDDKEIPSRASHREGAFTQFVLPSRPNYSNDNHTSDINHDHTLHLDITHGNNVQIIWNHQSRTAKPIHIHGYKFVVAATHEADVFERCSIKECPDEKDWFSWPAHKHVIDETINEGFVVKDTAVLPAGGYLVTRLIADNPGDWLAHSQIDFHLSDGMGLILRERSPSQKTLEIVQPPGHPECKGITYEAFDHGAASSRQPACTCLADPETILNAAPEMEWKCSKEHLCRHEAVIEDTAVEIVNNIKDQKNSEKVRGLQQQMNWKKFTVTTVLSICIGLVLLWLIVRSKPSDELQANSTNTRNLMRLICYDEWLKRMTLVAFIQVVGLSVVGGAIYFGSGFDVGERGFREKLAFVFWMCAFWSIGTIYSSIVTYYSDTWTTYDNSMVYKKSRRKIVAEIESEDVELGISLPSNTLKQKSINEIEPEEVEEIEEDPEIHRAIRRPSPRTLEVVSLGAPMPTFRRQSFVTLEKLKGDDAAGRRNSTSIKKVIQIDSIQVSILSYHITRWFIGVLLSCPFAILFAVVTDTLTQLAPNTAAVFLTALILLLTQQAFDALGRLLAEISGRKSIGRAVCFGTIVSQMLVIAGGFYRTVNPVLSAIGPIRYSFSAISKLHFSSNDAFWCTPERALAWHGYTWCSLELSGAVADLKFRGINIIDSYKTPSIWPDVLALVGIITFLRFSCYVVACIKARRKHQQRTQESEKTKHHQDTDQYLVLKGKCNEISACALDDTHGDTEELSLSRDELSRDDTYDNDTDELSLSENTGQITMSD